MLWAGYWASFFPRASLVCHKEMEEKFAQFFVGRWCGKCMKFRAWRRCGMASGRRIFAFSDGILELVNEPSMSEAYLRTQS